MHRLARILLALFTLLTLTTCSKDDSPVGPETPSEPTVTITGTATFPSTSGVDLKTVTVGLAEFQSPLDSSKGFKLGGRSGAPGLVFAAGPDSIPLLMAPVSRPESAGKIPLNTASTALALVYLHPFVCPGNSDESDAVLSRLSGLTELRTLETLVNQKLAANPRALSLEDAALETAVGNVVLAYLNSIQIPSQAGGLKKTGRTLGDVITISPTTPVSGHELKYLSGETFSLSNAYGRWAYAVTPTDSFFLFPNGSLLDAIRTGVPWAPSVKQFSTPLPAVRDSIFISVYGLGWKNDPTNSWDALSDQEKYYANKAGFSTIMFELVPHIISTVTNTAHWGSATAYKQSDVTKAISHLFNDPRTYDRCMLYISAKDYMGLSWFLAKWTLGKLVNSEEFRRDYLPAALIDASVSKLPNLTKVLHLGLKTALVSESLTSTMKTYLGFREGRFKTRFKIWRDAVDFGTIGGSVHDKSNGSPIAGATVVLKGDDGNPMNPPHQVTSGTDGGFLFQNITTGPKTVEVSKTGYSTASVAVTVTKGGTASVLVELTKDAGRLTGKVLNDIFRKNNVSPANFKGQSYLTVLDLSGQNASASYWIYDGAYSVNLPAATYKVIAWHEDYLPDTIQVTVQTNTITTAPDLILEPIGFMAGEIRIDMNMDGSDEYKYSYGDSSIACFRANDFGTCPSGVRGPVVWIGKWPPIVGLDAVSLVIDPGVVQGSGIFNLGGMDLIACPAAGIGATMDFRTNRVFCSDPSIGATGSMAFTILAGGNSEPCNCGIGDPGRLVLEEYGTELGSRIKGTFNGMLAGWKECACNGGAVTNCAKAYVSVRFQVLLGAQ